MNDRKTLATIPPGFILTDSGNIIPAAEEQAHYAAREGRLTRHASQDVGPTAAMSSAVAKALADQTAQLAALQATNAALADAQGKAAAELAKLRAAPVIVPPVAG